MGRCHSCGNEFAEGEALCRACGANLLGAGSTQGQQGLQSNESLHAPQRATRRGFRGTGARVMFAVTLVAVLGIALVSRSVLNREPSQSQLRATQIAANQEDRAAHVASTAAVRATDAAHAAQVHTESTVDAQLSSGITRLQSQATAVARGSAIAQARSKAAATAQARARSQMAARLRSVTNADGSHGLYDPVTLVGADAGSVALDVVGGSTPSSRRQTYLWMIAVEINDGLARFASSPTHFRLVGSDGTSYQLASINHRAGSGTAPLRPAVVLRGQTNQGFLAFALPSNRAHPAQYLLLWHEEPGTAWRTLCRVQVAASGRVVLLP